MHSGSFKNINKYNLQIEKDSNQNLQKTRGIHVYLNTKQKGLPEKQTYSLFNSNTHLYTVVALSIGVLEVEPELWRAPLAVLSIG